MPLPTTLLRTAVLPAIAGLAVTGCAGKKTASAPAGAAKVTVELTDDGCMPSPAQVAAEAAKMVTAAKKFTDAVRAGDIDRAKDLYAPARFPYEEVEPVSESFGDLDPDIDARVGDVTDPAKWTGFHRLEKALWQDKSL